MDTLLIQSLTDQLIARTREMRQQQRDFFATRNRDYLYRAQALEKKVDKLLNEIDIARTSKQTTLFNS